MMAKLGQMTLRPVCGVEGSAWKLSEHVSSSSFPLYKTSVKQLKEITTFYIICIKVTELVKHVQMGDFTWERPTQQKSGKKQILQGHMDFIPLFVWHFGSISIKPESFVLFLWFTVHLNVQKNQGMDGLRNIFRIAPFIRILICIYVYTHTHKNTIINTYICTYICFIYI